MKIKKFEDINEGHKVNQSSYDDRCTEFLGKIDDLESDIRKEIVKLMVFFEMKTIKFDDENTDALYIIDNKDEPRQVEVKSIRLVTPENEVFLTISSPDDSTLDDVWRVNDLYNIYCALRSKIDETFVYQEELIRTNNIQAVLKIKERGYLDKRILKKYPHIFTGKDLNLL